MHGRFKEVENKMDRRFKEVEKRFEEVEKKMDGGFEDVENKMRTRFDQIQKCVAERSSYQRMGGDLSRGIFRTPWWNSFPGNSPSHRNTLLEA